MKHIYNYKYGKLVFKNKTNRNEFFKNNSKTYQEYINDIFKKYYKINTNILDVGANVGIFTISFSKISKNCMIHSFECDQETFNYLEETVKKNKENNVKIYNFGLSDQNKESIMNCSLIKPGINSLTLDLSKSSNIVQKNVKLKTLDSLNLTNISFIKVDIERHELYFLKGAKNTLINNNATVILEIPCRNEEEIELHNNCVELMKSYGYKFYKKIVDKDYVFRKEEF